jgi:DNA polymerase elongation subunit (family B)
MKFYTNVQLLGDYILYRGYENGSPISYRESFSPTLFVPSKIDTKHKTLHGEYVKPIKFNSPRDAREFIKKYDSVDGFEVYGYERFVYQYISDKHPETEISYDMTNLSIYTIDIETTSENGFPNVEEAIEEILCITVKDFNSKKIIVWGVREFDNTRKDVKYVICDNEQDLLYKFLNFWVQNTPDIVTGWNVNLFDIPFICRRMEKVLSDKHMKSLSPWNKVDLTEIYIQGRKNIAYNVLGVSILDYLDLYKKFTYTNQESYRLDYIAEVELDQNKLDHSEFETFRDFYTYGWQKFIEYNIHDVELVDRLEDKMKLIELAVTMAYDAKVNFDDVYSQVRMWDTLIFNFLKKQNLVVPPKQGSKKDDKYAGAYVKEPIPGLYDWVVSFDLNSLYPHLIMQYNISPETLSSKRYPGITVDKLLNREINLDNLECETVCANGAMYDTHEQGFLPKMMQRIYDDRTIYKKKMLAAKQEYENTKNPQLLKDISKYNNIQMARKIQLNSAYGAIGNQYFRYYNLANAEAITLSGQLSIRWIEKKLNSYLNNILKTENVDYVIAIDTDSIYLCLDNLVQTVYKGREKTTEGIVTFLDKVCKLELEKYIENSYQELADYVHAFEQKMFMKRETIANKGIWTAKKRYILNAWDIEGVRYTEPKLKIMGIEAVKSSTPGPCRQKIKDALKLMMSGTEEDLIKFIEDFRNAFKQLPTDQIAFPRSVNGLKKFYSSVTIYGKSTPIHVRGALLYNFYLKHKNLQHKYPLIQDGEKIKFVYLRTPNKINENVISFIQTIPTELGIDKSIDHDLQFEKSFLEPLKTILDIIGWKTERVNTLEFLFGD